MILRSFQLRDLWNSGSRDTIPRTISRGTALCGNAQNWIISFFYISDFHFSALLFLPSSTNSRAEMLKMLLCQFPNEHRRTPLIPWDTVPLWCSDSKSQKRNAVTKPDYFKRNHWEALTDLTMLLKTPEVRFPTTPLPFSTLLIVKQECHISILLRTMGIFKPHSPPYDSE